MSKLGVQAYAYLGVVSEVLGDTPEQKQEYKILADIPGVIKGVTAYPRRDTLDEPRPGDPIILLSLDPDFNSYYLYWKLKEDDFTGFRSAGKEVVLSPDHILLNVYDQEEYDPHKEIGPGEMTTSIELCKNGDINIHAQKDINITINGNAEIKVQGSTTVSGPDIEINAGALGTGVLKVKAAGVIPNPEGGPFLSTAITPPQGSPLPSGDTIILQGG